MMPLRPFLLERYFARYEFSTPWLLASSDCEALTLDELLELATPIEREAWRTLKLGYTESSGHPELRSAIASTYPGLTGANIVTAAPEEIIYLLMRTLLAPGDRVVVTFPGYQSLYEIASSIGCEVIAWKPREEADRWKFHTEDLEPLLTQSTKALIVNFPHNPTGALPSAGEWQRITELTQQSGACLISDEMYRGLERDSLSLTPAVLACEKSITIAGLSKSYGLAGLRCGWAACRDRNVLDKIGQYKDYTTICSAAPAEMLSIIALRNQHALQQRCREIIERNLPLFQSFLSRHADRFEPRWPGAGPVCFPRLRGESAESFCRRSAAEAGVMLLPSTVYEAGDAHIRIGIGRTSLAAALDRMDDFLSSKGSERG